MAKYLMMGEREYQRGVAKIVMVEMGRQYLERQSNKIEITNENK